MLFTVVISCDSHDLLGRKPCCWSQRISNQKQPNCKKRSAALEKAIMKKDVKSKVAAKKWL